MIHASPGSYYVSDAVIRGARQPQKYTDSHIIQQVLIAGSTERVTCHQQHVRGSLLISIINAQETSGDRLINIGRQ